VIQKMRQLMIQKTAIKFVRRWAVRSFDSSALQSDLRILWNTSVFHRIAYHWSFSMASLRDCTGKSVISFQWIFFDASGSRVPQHGSQSRIRPGNVCVYQLGAEPGFCDTLSPEQLRPGHPYCHGPR
jgi:hypothetical protein